VFLPCDVEGQTCCGQPAFNSGYWDEARAIAEHSLDGGAADGAGRRFFVNRSQHQGIAGALERAGDGDRRRVEFEAEFRAGGAELDDVVVAQARGVVDALAVEEGAVAALQVDDGEVVGRFGVAHDLDVLAAD